MPVQPKPEVTHLDMFSLMQQLRVFFVLYSLLSLHAMLVAK